MRGVTAGSDTTNTTASTPSSRRDSASSAQILSITVAGNGISPQRNVLHELREIERGVARHRRDDAAAREVKGAPHRTEHARGQHGVDALLDVAKAEEDA